MSPTADSPLLAARPMAPLVLFDLDGTLVDSAPDLCSSANHLRALRQLPPIPLDQFRTAVSRGSRAMLELAFPALDASARESLVTPFLTHYAAHIADGSVLFDQIDSVLAQIESCGSRWGVVTNKPAALAQALLDALQLSTRCAVLVGGDTLAVRKPDPEPLLHACRTLGVAAALAVYVGDDERDVIAARAAGIKSIAVAWGYRAPDAVIAGWGADLVLESASDLLGNAVLSSATQATGD